MASFEAKENLVLVPTIRLIVRDGLLLLERGEKVLILDPISDTSAAVRGLGRIGGSAAHVVFEKEKEKIRFMMEVYTKLE
jgi:hypothetical protein